MRKPTNFFKWILNKFIKKADDASKYNDDLEVTYYMMTEYSFMITVIFHNLKGYDYITREYANARWMSILT